MGLWGQSVNPLLNTAGHEKRSFTFVIIISATSSENVPSLSTATIIDVLECIDGEQRCGWYFVHVQDDPDLHILHMFEDSFLLGTSPVNRIWSKFRINGARSNSVQIFWGIMMVANLMYAV